MSAAGTGGVLAGAGKERWFPPLALAGLSLLTAASATSVALTSLTLGACSCLALADLATRPRLGWRRTPLDEPLAWLLGITVLSTAAGLDPSRSAVRLVGMWIVMIYYFTVWYAGEERRLRVLIHLLCATGSAVAVFAVVQHFTGFSPFTSNPLRTITFPGGMVRHLAQGTFSHHQTFANVYFQIFCLAFSLFLASRGRKARLLWLASSLLLGAALFFSYTRGIWLACLVAILFMAYCRSSRALAGTLAFLLLVVAFLFLVPTSFSQRAQSIFSLRGNLDRILIWETSWTILRDHPLTGIGMGNYARLHEEFFREGLQIDVNRSHAHNTYLQLGIERGVFGLVAFGWLWYGVLRRGLAVILRHRGREDFRTGAVRGAVAGVLGFLLDGMFENNFGDSEVVTVLFFLAAVIVSLSRDEGGEPAGDGRA